MTTKPAYEELEQMNKELESRLKEMEKTLRMYVERNKLATSAAKVGVWDWNIETGEFYLDPNIKAILGYTDDEILNDIEVWVKFVYPEDIITQLKVDKTVWENYQNFSESYIRIRIAYIDSARNRPDEFDKRLNNFIEKTKENKLIKGFGGIDKYY